MDPNENRGIGRGRRLPHRHHGQIRARRTERHQIGARRRAGEPPCRRPVSITRSARTSSATFGKRWFFVATFAGLTALMRLPIGPLRENAGTRVMSRAALDEAHAVARAKGIGLPDDFVERTLAGCDGLPSEMKSSMLQDLERGRRLEMSWLSGTIVRLGQELGTPTLPMPSSPPHSSCMRRAEVDRVVAKAGVPTGNRTRVFALKGRTSRPCPYGHIRESPQFT